LAERVVIIGGGPAGYVAAIRAAQLGARVTIVENIELGGVCTNCGCIPTKTYYHYAETLIDLKKAEKDGIFAGDIDVDWRKMVSKKDGVVRRSRKGIEYLLKKNEIRFIAGTGSVTSPGKVEIVTPDKKTEVIETDYILIATGSEPASIPVEGWQGAGVWTSTEALATQELPESLIIIGGGVIGCEFAHIFASFGCKVTIIEIMETILPGMDSDIVEAVTRALAKEGVSIRTGVTVRNVERTAEGVIAHTDDERFAAKEILGAVGRNPTPPDGLEKLDIAFEKRAIVTDDKLRATEGIWAVGDVTGAPFLAHRASAMGEIAVENMLGANKSFNKEAIPGAFFTALEVGTIGLTENEARDRFSSISVGKFPYIASGRAHTASAIDGFAKVIADDKGVIVGIHIAGRESAEMSCSASLAVNLGLKIDDWRATIIAHPTFGEILREASLDTINEAIHK